MACDLYHLFTHQGNPCPSDFYLSHVRLAAQGASVSSLPDFDNDIAALFELTRPISITKDMSLCLPVAPNCLANPLIDFWKIVVNELEIRPLPHEDPTLDSSSISSEIASEFYESMRHAFDSVTQADIKNTFTLRAEWTKELHLVSNGFGVHYTLGYWLPATGLLSLPPAVPQKEFEKLLKTTERTPRIRQQSHTNVSTRLAALICQPSARSDRFSNVGEEYSYLEDLEKIVWPHGEYGHIFMSPLPDHDLSSRFPRTVAHAYKGFPKGARPDIEQLLLWRYRATMLFAEGLRRGYCHAVARHLATHLLAQRKSLHDLNTELMELASVYSMPPMSAENAGQGAASVLSDLKEIISSPIAPGVAERSRQWLHAIDKPAANMRVIWNSTRTADTIAVRVWLARELDAQIRESMVLDQLAVEKNRIEDLANGIRQSTAVIDDLLNEDQEATRMYDRLIAMWRAGLFKPGIPHESSNKIRFEGYDFRQGHDKCSNHPCEWCDPEERRRIACLFEISVKEFEIDFNEQGDANAYADFRVNAARRYMAYCARTLVDGNRNGAWLWIKRAAEFANEGKVNLACIVTLLFAWVEKIETINFENLTTQLQLLPNWSPRWRSMLRSLARLATPRQETNGISIDLRSEDKDLIFVLRGLDFSWFDKSYTDSRTHGPMRVNQASGDRLQQVACALGAVLLPVKDHDGIDVQTIENCGALKWTWKNVL